MKQEYIKEELKTPVRYRCDVAVCGGGTAGIMAALAAARNGAETILIEREGYLGGTLVNGAGPLHSFFNRYQAYSDIEKKQVVKGMPQELIERLVKEGGSLGHIEQKKGGDYDSAITLIDWEIFKEVIFSILEEEGVQIFLHTEIVGVLKKAERLTGVILQGKSGREVLLAHSIVDTTGDGDVAFLAGAGYVKRHDTTSVGMPFGMADVDMMKLAAWLKEKGLIYQIIEGDKGDDEDKIIRLGFHLKEIPEFTEFMEKNGMWGPLGFSYRRNNFTYINAANLRNVDATDTKALSKAEITLRHQIMTLAKMLKKYIPGFENAYVNWTPNSAGIRLTRIIECEYDLSVEEIIQGKRFEDQVFLYGFHDCAPRIAVKDGGSYGFPYRAMIPKKIEGLLVAGRCLTSAWEAHMSTRNTVSCMAQGQAAGTAAAICARNKILPRKVDILELQTVLRSQGTVLE